MDHVVMEPENKTRGVVEMKKIKRGEVVEMKK